MSETIKHLWALDAPTVTMDNSIMMLNKGGTQLTFPLPSFLIEHPAHGLLIFDTGIAGPGDPASIYGPAADLYGIDFPAEYALDTQLESLGFSTGDVKRVVLSHLHFDHTGGLSHFPGTIGYLGSGELRYAQTPDHHTAMHYMPADLKAAKEINWHEIPEGYDHDVFGDGSVVVMSLPGHTPGSLGVALHMPDRSTLVLTGDVAHEHDNVSCCAGMMADSDTVSAIESLKKLRLLRSRPNTRMWVNHDPQDWARYRPNGRQVV